MVPERLRDRQAAWQGQVRQRVFGARATQQVHRRAQGHIQASGAEGRLRAPAAPRDRNPVASPPSGHIVPLRLLLRRHARLHDTRVRAQGRALHPPQVRWQIQRRASSHCNFLSLSLSLQNCFCFVSIIIICIRFSF